MFYLFIGYPGFLLAHSFFLHHYSIFVWFLLVTFWHGCQCQINQHQIKRFSWLPADLQRILFYSVWNLVSLQKDVIKIKKAFFWLKLLLSYFVLGGQGVEKLHVTVFLSHGVRRVSSLEANHFGLIQFSCRLRLPNLERRMDLQIWTHQYYMHLNLAWKCYKKENTEWGHLSAPLVLSGRERAIWLTSTYVHVVHKGE